MSRQPATEMQPTRFCKNDGVETGIHVAEGYDLCLDCYRAYLLTRSRPAEAPGSPTPEAPADLFRRRA